MNTVFVVTDRLVGLGWVRDCLDYRNQWRNTMRAFLLACLYAAVIATGAAVILGDVMQESATTAFAELGVRL